MWRHQSYPGRVPWWQRRMSSFVTSYAKSLAFTFTRLVYVHCVSKENFSVSLKGFQCAKLTCKVIHVSYLENMSERRVCFLPKMIEENCVLQLFKDVRSPAMIRIKSSCDITVSMLIIILWIQEVGFSYHYS